MVELTEDQAVLAYDALAVAEALSIHQAERFPGLKVGPEEAATYEQVRDQIAAQVPVRRLAGLASKAWRDVSALRKRGGGIAQTPEVNPTNQGGKEDQ